MRGRLWLMYFIREIDSTFDKSDAKGKRWIDSKWTEFMRSVLDCVADKMDCYVARLRPENKAESGEYLNIDAFFIDNAEYDIIKEKADSEWDPFILPRAVVELENSYEVKKISYCLWKILCLRAPIRVLICYQRDTKGVTSLAKRLEGIIWQGSLMKGTDGDLLVIIGDDSAGDDASWREYFTIFEWRNDRLEIIKGLEW